MFQHHCLQTENVPLYASCLTAWNDGDIGKYILYQGPLEVSKWMRDNLFPGSEDKPLSEYDKEREESRKCST